jgi:hypothetical protein
LNVFQHKESEFEEIEILILISPGGLISLSEHFNFLA